jgi:guanylate kinase
MTKRLVILSGPSCVGKSPLTAAVKKYRPEVKFVQATVIKSKESRYNKPRPDEVSVWDNPDNWRTMAEIETLKNNPRFVVDYCHGFAQVIDLDKIINAPFDAVLMESYYTMAQKIVKSDYLAGVDIKKVFLSPISCDEIPAIKDILLAIKSLMMFKQYQRAEFHGRKIDAVWLADMRHRVDDAIKEIRVACDYDYVLVNHDGEGAENWQRHNDGVFYGKPIGDAGLATDCLADILAGKIPPNAEHWHNSVLR